MAGPHANAYLKLNEHVGYVNSKGYHLQFYTDFVNNVQGQVCATCHATDNLYEHYFKQEHSVNNLIQLYNDGVTRLPKVRQDVSSYSTGVDCMTCHYNGKKVVTNSSFVSNPDIVSKNSCLPIGSDIFKSNFNCMPCHSPNMTEHHTFYYPETKEGTSCISCHQEYDDSGKGTHYYYWRFDPKNKERGKLLTDFYKPKRIERKGDKILVQWDNNYMPHRVSDCPEQILYFEVKDTIGMVYGNGELRINRKKQHDQDMADAHVFKENSFPGINGISPVLNKSDTVITISLKPNPKAMPLFLDVRALNKPQYWESDSLGIIRFRHRIAIP